jgi:hypothetical protein
MNSITNKVNKIKSIYYKYFTFSLNKLENLFIGGDLLMGNNENLNSFVNKISEKSNNNKTIFNYKYIRSLINLYNAISDFKSFSDCMKKYCKTCNIRQNIKSITVKI